MKDPRFDPHPLEVREKAFLLFKQGRTQVEIAEMMKIPIGTLRRWSSTGLWKDRVHAAIPMPGRRGMNAGRVEPSVFADSSSPEAEALAETMSLAEQQEDYQKRMQAQALRLPRLLAKMTDQELLMGAEKIAKADGTARKALKLEESKPAVVVNVGLLASPLPARPALIVQDAEIVAELPAPTPEEVEEKVAS